MLFCRKNAVLVGSTNPVKLNATKQAFRECFGSEDFLFYTLKAKSLVSDQPMSDEETKRGAQNRAMECYRLRKEVVKDRVDVRHRFCVGVEGGCTQVEESGCFECFAWIAVFDVEEGKMSYSRSASFLLPEGINMLLRKGIELGTADDMVYHRTNSKQNSGTVG